MRAYKEKNILVYGLSLSGEWVAKLLLKLKANVFLYDDDSHVLKAKNLSGCYMLEELNENLISQFDFLVVSPGIDSDNQFLQLAKKLGIKIYSELEFASQFCKNIVAVTGTNGKTTTVQLITAILQKKYKAIACGNIGYPLSRAVLEAKKSLKVAEVSSFMLEHAETFAPRVATVLNIEPDHLIRHKTMEEYSKVKRSIFKNLKSSDFAVVNLDKNIYSSVESLRITYSYSHLADVYIKNGYIYLHNDRIIALNELKLKGKHNVYNIMCAICYGYIYKVKPKKIREALINFSSEKYRIEYVEEINGIHFVNDSKSTNIASTLAAVETVKGAIILLLGGSKKGLDYTKLFSKLSKRVKSVVVYGEIANELILANDNKFDLIKAKDLSSAFDESVKLCKPGDTVLLSPASASYDQFSSYIERGKVFNQKVKEYEIEVLKK